MKKKLILVAGYVLLVLLMLVAFSFTDNEESLSFAGGGQGEPFTGEFP